MTLPTESKRHEPRTSDDGDAAWPTGDVTTRKCRCGWRSKAAAISEADSRGPVGIADRLARFLTNSAQRSPIEQAFAVTELADGHRVDVGDLRLTSAAVEHGMPAFAVRVDTGDRGLVYSGDTAPCPNLNELARDCDVLLCEADGDREPGDECVHHTPEEAGDTATATATAAGAGRLLLTHVGRSLTPRQAVARYRGVVDYAAPGTEITIG